MEAPEKIYRTTTYLDSDRGKTVWKNKPVPGAENIEYTQTDVLIEKAWDWIENNMLSSNQQDKSSFYFEQFVNHIKV